MAQSLSKINSRVTVEIYQVLVRTNSRRRIASLPDADDELVDMLKRKYPQPRFWVRLITELF